MGVRVGTRFQVIKQKGKEDVVIKVCANARGLEARSAAAAARGASSGSWLGA